MTELDRLRRECRELTPDELNDVSGGVVCITHPPNPCTPTGIYPGSVILASNGGVGGGMGAGKVDQASLSIIPAMDKTSPPF